MQHAQQSRLRDKNALYTVAYVGNTAFYENILIQNSSYLKVPYVSVLLAFDLQI